MKALVCALAFLASGASRAEKTYHTLFMNGQRVGYATTEEKAALFNGKTALRTESHMTGRLSLGGTPFQAVTDTVTWTTPEGRLLHEASTNVMNGVRLKTDAVLTEKTVEVDVEDAGVKSHKSVPLPDGPVYGDPLWAIRHRLLTSEGMVFWKLDAQNGRFDRYVLKTAAPATLSLGGAPRSAQVAELKGESSVERYFTTEGGELLRWEMLLGLTMDAATKEAALARVEEPTEKADIILANALKTDRPLENATKLRRLKLRFTNMDLSKAPSDEAQTVTKDGDGWIVEVAPALFQIAHGAPPANSATQDAYLKPDRYLSSDDPAIRRLAEKLAPKGAGFPAAVRAIREHVGEKMKYEIGFGDTRDAKDVLKKPKGKCTDYAILTAALLRAAGIPARICSGLVTGDGTFFYHAWAEAWDGQRWFGVDSTSEWDSFPAIYVKLSQGNVEEGFRTIYPNDPKAVKIEVLSAQP